MLAALKLLNNFAQSNISVAKCADYKWNMVWRKTSSDSNHSLQMSVQYYWVCSFPDLHGSGLIAFELSSNYFAQQFTHGIWLLLQLVSVEQSSKQLNT